eukprot:CAMPEP_0204204436 /NCGR_PEP_ID=MMETSP0361-20130328/69620_1 /ASSEMBLY_ACC=CAM_ASM_000343 /TAXON_ID=268821 /ORGANISM="Scrippsiella Hangoei, Strain SHTV-5" /LENGTH=144 /DNA_ID=CAMNT_0051167531 /DNA_START=18 /DNA_END=451 /DNA_ORIENTATION=-
MARRAHGSLVAAGGQRSGLAHSALRSGPPRHWRDRRGGLDGTYTMKVRRRVAQGKASQADFLLDDEKFNFWLPADAARWPEASVCEWQPTVLAAASGEAPSAAARAGDGGAPGGASGTSATSPLEELSATASFREFDRSPGTDE